MPGLYFVRHVASIYPSFSGERVLHHGDVQRDMSAPERSDHRRLGPLRTDGDRSMRDRKLRLRRLRRRRAPSARPEVLRSENVSLPHSRSGSVQDAAMSG